MAQSYQNWSGSVQFQPQQISTPSSEEEIIEVVKNANHHHQRIRLVGSGHSFTPLIHTSDTLMSLDNWQGVIHADLEQRRAIAKAGTKLRTLGELLHQNGMAMENLGDIDVQSIAGAISTSTHGTGVTFGTIATQVVGLTLVTGRGDILHCSETENADLFKAAQISLGSLGIITRLELRVMPSYKLQYTSGKADFEQTLGKLDEYNQNRHFELYWFPYTNTVQTKVTNITQEKPHGNSGFGKWFNEMFMENTLFGFLSGISRHLGAYKMVSKLSAWGVGAGTKVDYSHKVFATKRLVRFHEMEYNIPAEHFKDCIREVKKTLEGQNHKVHFPLELRWAKGDDIWLSPAHNRDSAYIAVHMYKGMPYRPYFQAMEAIFRKYQGRPHWGKMHTLTAKELAPLYPKWNEFHQMRRECDPNGVFMNDYLKGVFG